MEDSYRSIEHAKCAQETTVVLAATIKAAAAVVTGPDSRDNP